MNRLQKVLPSLIPKKTNRQKDREMLEKKGLNDDEEWDEKPRYKGCGAT